jgi:hypothetical protein
MKNNYLATLSSSSSDGDISSAIGQRDAWAVKLSRNPTSPVVSPTPDFTPTPTPAPTNQGIIIDGNSSDWVNIPSMGSGDSGLDNMYAAMDSENLYIMVEGQEVKGAR